MKKPNKEVPNKYLKHQRERHNWSQADVAEKLGTSPVNVSRWERGTTFPNPYFRHKLCTLFEKSPEALGLFQDTPESGLSNTLYDSALPLPLTRQQMLIGRESELDSLKQRLCQREAQALVALHGLPGVGKTSLAITIAYDHQIQEYFCDGILWADLGLHPNISGLLSRWGKLLGVAIAETDSDDWLLALRTAMRARRMLLIIDDAWDLKDVLALKVGGPDCAYLVTTRFPHLALHFADTDAMVIHELNEMDSAAFLRRLAPDVFVREPEAVQPLVALVGGLPLGLVLMGKYLRAQGYSGQTRRIHQALDRLHIVQERLMLTEPQRLMGASSGLPQEAPVSLQTVIALSEQQLSTQVQDALRALSVFPAKPNSFTEEAALAVCKLPVEVLDALSDVGLLETRRSNRYMLHQTIADYAKASLVDTSAFVRMVEYFINYVEAHAADYDVLEQEESNILAALETAFTLEQQADFVRGVSAWTPFLESRGMYNLEEKLLKRAQEAAQALQSPSSLMNILLSLGSIAEKQGRYVDAETYLQKGLLLARQTGDSENVCAFLRDLGVVTRRNGDYKRAEMYLQESLVLARSIGHLELVSSLLTSLGAMAGEQGIYAQAEAYLQEGLMLTRQLEHRERICFLLSVQGALALKQGKWVQAEAYLREGLAFARRLGHSERISTFLTNLGAMATDQKNYTLAEEYFQEGLELTRSLGHPEGTCLLLVNLAIAVGKKGEYERAAEYLHESLLLGRKIDYSWIISIALIEQGEIYLKLQQIEEASSSFSQALEIAPLENQELVAVIRYGLARVAAAQNNTLAAYQRGQESLNIFEAMGHVKTGEVRAWLEALSSSVERA